MFSKTKIYHILCFLEKVLSDEVTMTIGQAFEVRLKKAEEAVISFCVHHPYFPQWTGMSSSVVFEIAEIPGNLCTLYQIDPISTVNRTIDNCRFFLAIQNLAKNTRKNITSTPLAH